MENIKDITVFAKTNFRNKDRVFGVKTVDRRQHMYVIGKTGTGKTTMLFNMALQDIINGRGVCIVDPHGEFVETVMKRIPKERLKDVVYFNPIDAEHPIGFNVLEVSDLKYKHLVSSDLMAIFTKIWANVWSARMEYILSNCVLALIDTPGTTLLGIPRILVDKDFRAKIVYKIEDPIIKAFWLNEFEGYGEKMQAEAVAPIQNKVGQFTSSPLIRNIIGQKKSSFNIREVMDERKILIMNLSKGAVGEGGAQLLGAMMVTKMQMAAMSRVDIPQEERKDFFAYIDEFQNFSTDSFAEILSEARKYRLSLILAHQYIDQLPETVQSAVFGNVGTTVMFRIGAGDAERFEKEVSPVLTVEDLVSLPKWKIYLKLMIDGVTSAPFSADTLIDPAVQEISLKEQIIEFSSKTYGVPIAKLKEESEANSIPTDPQRNNGSNNGFKQNNRSNYQNNRQQQGSNQNRPAYQKPALNQNNNYTNKYNTPKLEISKLEDRPSLPADVNIKNPEFGEKNKEEIQKPIQNSENILNVKEEIKLIEEDIITTKSDTKFEEKKYLNIINSKELDITEKDSSVESISQEIVNKVESLENSEKVELIETKINPIEIDKNQEISETKLDLDEKEEVQNPILARKLKEIFSKSQNPFGGIEYNVKSNILKKEYDKETEERLSDDNLVGELLDEFSQRFLEKKISEDDLEIPKLVKFKK